MSNIITRPSAPALPDPEAVQRLVTRRLALRLGLTAPVATVVASLAGLGPEAVRR